MSIQPPGNPVSGRFPPSPPIPAVPSSLNAPAPKARDAEARDPAFEDTPFSRLVRLARSNEQLFERLRLASDRLRGIRSYLGRADANLGLGGHYYRHWRAKHTVVLMLLRANRIEARRLLAGLEPAGPEGSPVATGA